MVSMMACLTATAPQSSTRTQAVRVAYPLCHAAWRRSEASSTPRATTCACCASKFMAWHTGVDVQQCDCTRDSVCYEHLLVRADSAATTA